MRVYIVSWLVPFSLTQTTTILLEGLSFPSTLRLRAMVWSKHLSHFSAEVDALGFRAAVPFRAHRHGSHAHVHADGRPIFDGMRFRSVLDAETGRPRAGVPVDGHLSDRANPPELFHHHHPPGLRQDDNLALNLHRIGAIVCPEALLMLAPLQAR